MEAPAAGPSEGRQIAWNTTLLGLGHAASLALGFVTTILVTDTLGEDRYGLLLGAQRLVTLLLVLAHFGLQPLLIREIAARRGEIGALLGTMLALRVGLGLAFAVLVAGAAHVGGYLPEHRWLLYAFAGVELTGAFAELYVAVCEGQERMGRAAAASVLRSVAVFGGVSFAALTGAGLGAIVAAYFAGRLLQLLSALALTRESTSPPKLRIRPRAMLPTLREAFPFFTVAFGYMAVRALDVTMLTRMAPVPEVSRYGAALNFLDLLFVLPALVQRALLPAFSRLHESGDSSTVAEDTLVVFSAVFLPAAVGLAFLSGSVVQLYPSGEFDDAAAVLALLAGALPFVGATTVCASLLTGAGRLWTIVAAYAVAVPIQVVANLALIPGMGAEGVALATVAVHGALAFFLALGAAGLGLRFPWRSLGRHALASAVMAGALALLQETPLLVSVVSGLVVYGATLLLVTPRDAVEWAIVRTAAQSLRRS